MPLICLLGKKKGKNQFAYGTGIAIADVTLKKEIWGSERDHCTLWSSSHTHFATTQLRTNGNVCAAEI